MPLPSPGVVVNNGQVVVRADLHIGMDSICILRMAADCGVSRSANKKFQRISAMPTATAEKERGRLRILLVAVRKLMGIGRTQSSGGVGELVTEERRG